MSLATCFDPLAFPYVRAQTYVDPNPPAVLSEEFYNPVQDAQARVFGALAGYSTSVSYEEFCFPLTLTALAVGDPFGTELAVLTNPGGNFQIQSNPVATAGHGVYLLKGVAAGNRGGAPGFQAQDAARDVGTLRWIFRSRVRCSKFSILAPGGLVLGLGSLTGVEMLPSWFANGGVWVTFWDGGTTSTAIPTVDGEWVTLWIAVRDADGVARWYLKRDADPLPLLLDTQTLTTAALTNVRRYLQYQVGNTAAAADTLEIDNISILVER